VVKLLFPSAVLVRRLVHLGKCAADYTAMSGSSVNFGWVTASIKKLQADLRALRRDIDMVREAQKDLPTVRELQSGLTSLDARVTELADDIVVRLVDQFEAAVAAQAQKSRDQGER
jgi:hypothetical protein